MNRDADIIYHEYTHAVLQRLLPNLNGEVEENVFGAALNEAYADYFACTINGDPSLGESTVGHPRGLRHLVNTRRYPEDVNLPLRGLPKDQWKPEAHWTGEIWGGACWELRERLGATVADAIIFGSIHYLPTDGNADFLSAAQAVVEADRGIYGGAHLEVIRQVLGRRGLLTETPLVIEENGAL